MSDVIPDDTAGDPCGNCEVERNQLVVLPSEQDHRQGSLNARVVLVEYGDYQCLQCSELYTSIQAIQRQLEATLFGRDSLCFVFRHFPQPQIHPQAQKAAAATEAAATQGQFWQMHEMLLKHQQELEDGYLAEYADNLGLDVTQFIRDIAQKVYVDRINQDIASGMDSGVDSTPALFINGVRYGDALELEPLLVAIVGYSHG
ncbi:DsbA family protein [Nostoc sp. UCD121]|uniref:DsbA family protein n=1 Tax=unclassified Nostoc TaxID=2593658 RepID=UPI0016239664|nr:MULTISPECIES: DsbA family protein [unclassified Nostoc]MBC1221197.1 DsbA family protein [Nostoc sp. UCD120]MBC1276839.1 DsbA family protein [Nostoc sp. UCD121]MBC1295012.1 DsbA family protein [Nostoc sp. UCD122]